MATKIDKETVEKVSNISRLNITKKEKQKFKKDLNSILEAFKELDKCKTDNIEPTFQPVDVRDVTREDEKQECFSQDKALKNTEHKEKGFFKGPKAV